LLQAAGSKLIYIDESFAKLFRPGASTGPHVYDVYGAVMDKVYGGSPFPPQTHREK
jgi:hypothetical protein